MQASIPGHFIKDYSSFPTIFRTAKRRTSKKYEFGLSSFYVLISSQYAGEKHCAVDGSIQV